LEWLKCRKIRVVENGSGEDEAGGSKKYYEIGIQTVNLRRSSIPVEWLTYRYSYYSRKIIERGDLVFVVELGMSNKKKHSFCSYNC
jgi:hypothetical protein